MTDPIWRHTWPEGGTDFVYERARDGDEPEGIGRIMWQTRSLVAAVPKGWSWSMTSVARPVGLARPPFDTHGFVETKQEAADALKAAWAKEAAWRAEVVAAGLPEGMASGMRAFLTTGMPTPPGRRVLPPDR